MYTNHAKEKKHFRTSLCAQVKLPSLFELNTTDVITKNLPCKNNQAIQIGCGLQKAWVRKSCEIKGGGHEMAAMMLMMINFNNALMKFIIINIIAVISWLPPLISQLFSPRLFESRIRFLKKRDYFYYEPLHIIVHSENSVAINSQYPHILCWHVKISISSLLYHDRVLQLHVEVYAINPKETMQNSNKHNKLILYIQLL